MISAVAFCPQAPVLVPLLSGAVPELEPVAHAVATAITRAAADVQFVVLLGAGPTSDFHPRFSRGDLSGFGRAGDLQLGGTSCGGRHTLPPSLTVGAWLLHGTSGMVRSHAVGLSVGPDDWAGSPAAAAAVDLLADDAPMALLVLGDGTARRTVKAPGYLDERAAAYDATIATALRSGDPAALTALDPVLGAELLAAGVPAWRRAGELLADPLLGAGPADSPWRADLLHESDPFGVDYLVATWTVDD